MNGGLPKTLYPGFNYTSMLKTVVHEAVSGVTTATSIIHTVSGHKHALWVLLCDISLISKFWYNVATFTYVCSPPPNRMKTDI